MPMLRLEDIERERPKSVDLPAPTAWPFVMAFGVALLAAGLVTTLSVSLTGAVLTLAAAVGWFRELFPHEKHETVPVANRDADVPTTEARRVELPAERGRWDRDGVAVDRRRRLAYRFAVDHRERRH